MRSLRLDFSAALRFFARHRSATAVMVATMAFALAANTVVFSVLKAFILSGLGFPEPENVMNIWAVKALDGRGDVNFFEAHVNIELIHANTRFAEKIGSTSGVDFNWQRDDGGTRRIQGARAQAEFFEAMRVQPVLGRLFSASEEGPGAAQVAVIGSSVWHSEFNGSHDVLGRVMRLNGVPHTIIGVLPPGFAQPQGVAVWLPYDLTGTSWTNIVGARQLISYARLAPGVTPAMAREELRIFAPIAHEAHPDNKNWRWTVTSVRESLLNGADRTILFVQVGAAVLLLLAISNLASLLMAWAAERQRETAMRLALGASIWRLARQFLVQSVMLVSLGGIAGVALAAASLPLLQRLNPDPALSAFLVGIELDTGTLGFAAALVLGTGLVAGLLPAWQARRTSFTDALRSETRGASLSREGLRWQKAMIVVQGAVSALILVGAALAGIGFSRLDSVELGFRTDNRAAFRIEFPEPAYASHEQRVQFVRDLEINLAREPAIRAYAFTATIPVGDIQWGGGFRPQRVTGDFDEEPSLLHFRRVSPGYIPLMGTPLIEGRLLDARDRIDSPHVAVISKAAADKFWPGESAIGRKLLRSAGSTTVPLEVVGVVGNVRDAGAGAPPSETAYVPWEQVSLRRGWVLLEGPNTKELIAAGNRALHATAPDVASFNTAKLEDLAWQANALPRLQISLLGVFAAIAVSIMALGSYGVMSQLVANRRKEMAIRAALGATRSGVLRLVLVQNARLACAGTLIGIISSWLAVRWAQGSLTGVPTDVLWPYAVVAALVLALTQVASFLPARRAAAQDVGKALTSG